MNNVLKKYGITGTYLLFVGTIQPRKNITRLIEAFSMVLRNKDTKILSERKDKTNNISISQYPNINLVIVGRPGWKFEEIYEAPKKFAIEKQVKFLDKVSDEELKVFYQNALFFILPSLYEGFGLPILEAMQNGCPVITSNISSMPEAGGEAVLYVDPNSTQDISAKMKQLLDDDKLRNELRKKGYQQVKKFNWEKTAQETLKALEGLLK